MGKCQWFLLCNNKATTTLEHSILGAVPICKRCKDKIESLERRGEEPKKKSKKK